jgi:hypothetical protein
MVGHARRRALNLFNVREIKAMNKILSRAIVLLSLSLPTMNAVFAEEICDWFPSGPRGSSKTYLCVEKTTATSGIISIKSANGSRSCDASIRGSTWTSACKISTDIDFDGLSVIKETSTMEFSVLYRINSETGRTAATLDFHKPEYGINGWTRWNLNVLEF